MKKISDKTLTSRNVKDILEEILETDLTIDEIITKNHITNITDNSYLEEVITKVLSENDASISDYLSGHDRAFKYLMGQVMKETKGSANPQLASKMLEEKLNELKH